MRNDCYAMIKLGLQPYEQIGHETEFRARLILAQDLYATRPTIVDF